jgi:beta-galactosidase GanA
VEGPATSKADSPLAQAYEFLSQLSPLILEHQASGTIAGVALDRLHPTRKVTLGKYTMELGFARGWGAPENPEYAAALIMKTGEDEYLIAGKGLTVSFSATTPGPLTTGLARVEEGVFSNGNWIPGRRLNGDEIMSGAGLRLAGDIYTVQKVQLYQYR